MTGKGAVSPVIAEVAEPVGRAELRSLLLTELERELPRARELRKWLHQNPETSGQEQETSSRLASELETPLEEAAGTGFVGRFGPEEGPAVLVRAELDALPIFEKTGVSWASANGAMHACGHDVHQAAWVAFCRAASRIDLPKAVAAVLQPREEAYPSGAKDLVTEGWLEKLRVDAAIAVHVHPALEKNHVAIGPGAVNAAADTIRVTYGGIGGHGAYPHKATSPVHALASLALLLPNLRQNFVDPTEPGVLTVGQIHSGDAANVIPESGYLEATLRTMSHATRERLYEAITAAAHAQADAWGLHAKVEIEKGEPVLWNREDLAARAQHEAAHLGVEVAAGIYSCGADDFSYFSERVDSLMIFAGVDVLGERVNLHSPYFLPDEDAVESVALMYVAGYLAALDIRSS